MRENRLLDILRRNEEEGIDHDLLKVMIDGDINKQIISLKKAGYQIEARIVGKDMNKKIMYRLLKNLPDVYTRKKEAYTYEYRGNTAIAKKI